MGNFKFHHYHQHNFILVIIIIILFICFLSTAIYFQIIEHFKSKLLNGMYYIDKELKKIRIRMHANMNHTFVDVLGRNLLLFLKTVKYEKNYLK